MSCVPIILLAAGASSRMAGADKLLLDVGGEPLLRRAARRAAAVGPVLVALPPAPHPRHDVLNGVPVQRVPVPDAGEGMNASLRQAVGALPQGADAAMVLLADLPKLSEEDLRTVLQSVEKHPDMAIWRGATATGEPGHPVVFSRELFGELLALTGDSGAQAVVARHRDRVEIVPLPADHARFDLDTPAAWAAFRADQP